MRYALIALLLTGCGLVKTLPSVQNCERVDYHREGNIVRIEADCHIPLQNDPLLSVTP